MTKETGKAIWDTIGECMGHGFIVDCLRDFHDLSDNEANKAVEELKAFLTQGSRSATT